jgi:predicted membrane-bound dolichyl-phosphate-mannose-protein mannosyltransferase
MKKDTIIILLAICILAFFLRIYNLNFRPFFLPDEEVYYRTALYYAYDQRIPLYSQFVNNVFHVEFPNHLNYEHPLLGKFLIALSILIFGNTVEGARFLSVILGTLEIPIVYKIFKKYVKESLALVSSLMFAFDPLNLSISRSIMLDGFAMFFSLLGLFFYLNISDLYKKLFFLSLFVGLSISTKLTFFPLIISVILLSIFNFKKTSEKLLVPFSLITIIFLIYFLSYIPYFFHFGSNEGILPSAYKFLDYGSHNFYDFLALQNWMLSYHLFWHFNHNFYDYLIVNPWFYLVYDGRSYQIFTANPIVVYSGIILLIIFPVYLKLFKIKKYYEILSFFLPFSLILFIKGLSWYLIFFNFLSLLIIVLIYNFINKNDNLSSTLYVVFLASIVIVNIIIIFYYFYI